ncbi:MULTISPECIES: glycosyltransferase family 4 protein [Paraburkholderia]|jgi:glycosyltransferase involved in cell wall biosynthesis|uniref:Glycosyltransferase family 1 protein n=1 Tax=Paraburkholderia hospita TaxID=169430 RepID=A0AAN1MIL2_9BURK|nr:glycosyltransferase family 4 protein [Paraburkholderia hospita]AUT68365.1 glycosyltransferase family 1 protein [Paraburkholderia hospita]OUL70392.1 glycosyl transferase [Paraburkholderia hospita]SEH80381.1 Glycosyltransferase involved in cell wall bisynthesis [Paraburkholderia hospita]
MTTKVHVHLFYGADPRFYRPGENIGCLYGYHHAESDEFQLSYSQDAKESKPVRLVRRALKTLLGFDLIHTLRNRDEMLRSDVIWTHTEQEWLSAALMLLMNGKREEQPLLLAQSVWLIDKWPNYGLLRRWFYRKLIGRADLLTTLARDNAELCREYFDRDATQLFYGLNTRDFPVQQPKAWQPNTPLRIAAIGNDRDRDWETLIKAVGNDPRFAVRLATRRRIPRALRSLNVQVAPAAGLKKQRELYDWADVVVVPLRPNTHASGITVMLEAAAVGKPMVVTNVGGLEDYFSARAAAYVPPFDADALREALLGLIASPDQALQQAQAASMQLVSRDHTTQHYAQQHVKLTRDLLRQQAQHAHPAQKANASGNARVPSQSRGGM